MGFASLHPSKRRFTLPGAWGLRIYGSLHEEFIKAVASSKLHLWAPGDLIDKQMHRRLLFCVAPWSLRDLELLDEVNQKLIELDKAGRVSVRVDVFSINSLSDVSDSAAYYPDLEIIVTPVVGLWINGTHQHTQIGAELAWKVLGTPETWTS